MTKNRNPKDTPEARQGRETRAVEKALAQTQKINKSKGRTRRIAHRNITGGFTREE